MMYLKACVKSGYEKQTITPRLVNRKNNFRSDFYPFLHVN